MTDDRPKLTDTHRAKAREAVEVLLMDVPVGQTPRQWAEICYAQALADCEAERLEGERDTERCIHCQRDDCPWLRGAPCQASALPVELAEVRARADRLSVDRDLATNYLRSMCDKAEDGDTCLLCGEDFDDNTPRAFPECPVPAARDFLKDPASQIDAVLRATEHKIPVTSACKFCGEDTTTGGHICTKAPQDYLNVSAENNLEFMKTGADGGLTSGEHLGTFTVGSEPPSKKASSDDWWCPTCGPGVVATHDEERCSTCGSTLITTDVLEQIRA